MRSFVVASVVPVALLKGEVGGTIKVVKWLSECPLLNPGRE